MRSFAFTLLYVLLISATGCNGKVATNMVEGLVTLDGAPLAGATVTFSPASQEAGMIAVGISDDAGKFTLQTQLGAIGKGTTVGGYTVTVVKVESVPTGKTLKTETGETFPESTEKMGVPELYTKSATSPLKQTIVSGLNKVELNLVSKP